MAMMVKVLVCGYATGVFSSRKIARKLHEDVAPRVQAERKLMCMALNLRRMATMQAGRGPEAGPVDIT